LVRAQLDYAAFCDQQGKSDTALELTKTAEDEANKLGILLLQP
jgi:hypothetical protein